MDIGDRLRAEVREQLDSRESYDLDEDYRRFLDAYHQWLQDPRYQAQAVSRAEGPQLGVAAYSLGTHLMAMDKREQARRWLQIAARYDVGDAALRLAHLYELERMSNLDTSVEAAGHAAGSLASAAEDEPNSAESRALERIWYGRARKAGYAAGEERPSIDLDLDLEECCGAAGKVRAGEEAQQMIAEALAEADGLRRRARADVQSIVDDARGEVERLALQRRMLVERLAQVRATLTLYPSQAGDRAALEHQLALCAQVLLKILQHDEPVSRRMIAAVIKELGERSPNRAPY